MGYSQNCNPFILFVCVPYLSAMGRRSEVRRALIAVFTAIVFESSALAGLNLKAKQQLIYMNN